MKGEARCGPLDSKPGHQDALFRRFPAEMGAHYIAQAYEGIHGVSTVCGQLG